MTFSHSISTVVLSCCLTDQVAVVTTAQEVQFVYDGVSIQCTVLICFKDLLHVLIFEILARSYITEIWYTAYWAVLGCFRFLKLLKADKIV